VARPAAVFFDVDFTLIYPGPRFEGSGYAATCQAHGVAVDPARFAEAAAAATPLLDSADQIYTHALFVAFTRRIIEGMGGSGPGVESAAKEIYEDWAEHRHFSLYPDVRPALRELQASGVRLGLISNSHRCLSTFAGHFGLDGLIAATVSSAEHGYLKPHPRIFQAALDQLHVAPADAVMVGDSLGHDILGARQVGMRAILLARGHRPAGVPADVATIGSLAELARILSGERAA
jgi:HAD superfamily hydrolase (TIGR01662 family)